MIESVEKESLLLSNSLAGEIEEGFDDAQRFSTRLNRYALAKKYAVRMSKHIRTITTIDSQFSAKELTYLAATIEDCGSYLKFRDYYTVGKIRLHSACFCRKALLCPLCAIRRGAKTLKAYTDKFAVVMAENPNLKPYLVTHTIKNREDLDDAFGHFTRSMKLLTKQRQKALSGSSRNLPIEMNKALGGVASIEIKRGTGSGWWHVHSHAVWLCENPPIQEEASQDWHKATGDSFVVDIRPFSGETMDDYAKGFMEVFKYAVKFSSMELADTWEVYNLLKGRHLISSWGLLRGVEVPESMADEVLDDLPYVELFYQYVDGIGYSFKKNEEVH